MAAFPVIVAGRRPHHYFRGLLKLHTAYGSRTRYYQDITEEQNECRGRDEFACGETECLALPRLSVGAECPSRAENNDPPDCPKEPAKQCGGDPMTTANLPVSNASENIQNAPVVINTALPTFPNMPALSCSVLFRPPIASSRVRRI